ncbi:hypothetical protein PspLS_06363 [Pyricularia sp. CBS 133598]|nr:hypothetical protein PspLS_06363 [Pyricularia sp. CBS 133598]
MGSITLPHTKDVDLEAASLTNYLLGNYSPDHGAGFITPTIYDTAWLALVKKRDASGQQKWLFPECFQYILDAQLADGGWQAYARVDGVLNTTASLLVLARHSSEPLQIESVQAADVHDRIERAKAALQVLLNAWWDVEETTHIGYQVIVPTLLRLLKEEGLSFEFQGEVTALVETHEAKLSAFHPEDLYGKTQTTALSHLEAFLGQIEYSKVAHHKVNGAFMDSPSSTAAYLIGLHDGAWDDQAEEYLVKVLTRTGVKSVPSAFPSTNFEFSWPKVLSTLLQAGFSAGQLGSSATEVVGVLDRAFEAGSNAAGFDDTAQILIALNKLGVPKSAARMIQDYETSNHQDGSFSGNCNILLALLHQPNPADYLDQIAKVLELVCTVWWKSNWPMQDKKNRSPFFPSMAIMQALVTLLEMVEGGKLPESLVSEIKIRTKISVAIFHAAIRTVDAQDSDGSWNQSAEETAYAVILISAAARVTQFDPVRQRLVKAVRTGETWLQSTAAQAGEHLWVGKVSYGSRVLARAYRLAALKSASMLAAESTIGHCLHTAAVWPESHGYVKVYRRTPLFCKVPEEKLLTAVIESSLILTMLREHTYDIFSRDGVSKDKYFTLVPFTWTGSCMLNGLQPSAEWFWEMTRVGILGFQTDEFFEGVLRPDELDLFTRYVKYLIPLEPGDSDMDPDSIPGIERLKPMHVYRDFIMEHWAMKKATPADRLDQARELRAYLLSQIHQTRLNINKNRQGDAFTHPQSYFMWARIVGTEHIASPIYFSFMACLIPQTVLPELAGTDILPTAEEKYYSEAVSKHSGAMCRMYNDLGSIPRDTAEKNLNSVHFPEFNQTVNATPRDTLWEIAQFERAAFEDALERLVGATRRRMPGMGEKMKRATEMRIKYWRMYCDITDLYGQIWVLRDFSAPVFNPAR